MVTAVGGNSGVGGNKRGEKREREEAMTGEGRRVHAGIKGNKENQYAHACTSGTCAHAMHQHRHPSALPSWQVAVSTQH